MQSRIGRRAAWLAVVLMATACSAPQEEVRPPEPSATTTETPPSSTMPAPPATTVTTGVDPSGEAQPPPPPDVTSTSDHDPAPTDSTTTTSLPTVTSAPAEPEEVPPTTRALPPDSLRFVEVAQGAQYPIFLTASKGAGHSYLAEQGGRILYLLEDEIGDQPVLDISEKVTFRGEQGLLGIALHPAQPSRMFVHYSNLGGSHRGLRVLPLR